MNDVKKFVTQWSGRGYEKGEMQSFWLSFLRDMLGVSEPEKFIHFELPVKLKHTSFIDAFLPDTKVIIEQKSLSENLSQRKAQSDGSTLTPYEQAQRYITGLPLSMPKDLRNAHMKNDYAVAIVYGWEKFLDDELKIIAELMTHYERLTNK